MIFDYSREIFQEWLTMHNVTFSRKSQNETAFDGVIKIYSLKTDNHKLNELLDGLYFGTFAFETDNGILLRQFQNKESWPKTMLVFLDTTNFKLTIIKKTDSSYQDWKTEELKRGNYKIHLTPKESIEFIDG